MPIVEAAPPGSKPATGSSASAIYHNYCSVCHGDRGDGKSRARGSLNPPPRDFTTASELTREAMITIVAHGKANTAMVGWKTQLSDAEIEAVVDYVRNTFMKVALDPQLQRGKTVYGQNCIACHGPNGEGSATPIAGSIPPRNFAAPQARAELTRERMIASVTNGRPNTAMTAYGGRLPAKDIEAVVDYVRAALMVPETDISGTNAHAGRALKPAEQAKLATDEANQPMPKGLKGDVAKGRRFYMANCATCHGAKGDGQGPRAYFINPKPRIFTDPAFQRSFNRPALYNATALGRLGTEMPAWNKVLSDQEIADVAEFVYQEFIRPKPTKSKN